MEYNTTKLEPIAKPTTLEQICSKFCNKRPLLVECKGIKHYFCCEKGYKKFLKTQNNKNA